MVEIEGLEEREDRSEKSEGNVKDCLPRRWHETEGTAGGIGRYFGGGGQSLEALRTTELTGIPPGHRSTSTRPPTRQLGRRTNVLGHWDRDGKG